MTNTQVKMESSGSGSRVRIYTESSRYLNDGGQLVDALENAFAMTAQPLRIATCGLLKAGKSSLLNALTDHLETELFATGAARTTVKNQTLTHQDFTFVDTPGLDATDADDTEAWKGLSMADVLLFVHDPGTGELHSHEVDFLIQLANQPGAQLGHGVSLVVILTHSESNAEVISEIGEKVCHQIRACLGVEPRLFQVSFTSYLKGKRESNQQLVEYSGIPALRQHLLENLAHMRNTAQALRQSRIRASRKRLMDAAVTAIAERRERITHIQETADQAHLSLVRDSDALFDTLRSKIAAYDKNN